MKKGMVGGTFAIVDSLKKSIFLFLLFLLFSSTGFSQRIYSKQHLEQASMEELNAYLKASGKLKKTGVFMSVAGPVTVLSGFIVFSAAWEEDWNDDLFPDYNTGADIGGYMILAGLVTTLVGVPVLISGSSRVKRIKSIMDKKSLSVEIIPYSSHNCFIQNTQPGITLRIKL